MNYDLMVNEKINSRLEFPELLDLKQYTFEAKKKKEEELKREKEQEKQDCEASKLDEKESEE